MRISTDRTSSLLKAYSLAKHSGFLETTLGRRIFQSAYFLYKRYIEDDLRDLVQAYPALLAGGDLLDVGANIGYTAAVLAQATAASQKVYAFEPEPFNFELLQQAAARTGLQGRIVPVQCAVGAENGTMELWVNPGHHADHRILTDQSRSALPASSAIRVPLVSLDSFVESKPGPISFVKIDVQGYEFAVCEGMQKTLQRNPDITVILEYMPSAMREMGFEPCRLIDFFLERDFRAYQIHSRAQLTQGVPDVPDDLTYFDLLFSRRDLGTLREGR